MIKKYLYNGKEYRSAYQVRQAIFEAERKAFPAEPEEGKAEFWAEHGVTYTEEEIPLDTLKSQKLAQLDRAFMQWRNDGATLISSLGFNADCDERAMIDVNGLVTICGETQTVAFMDADNQPHELSVGQLKVLQAEIIQSGTLAYQAKWQLRTAIESAESREALDAIEIKFTAVDFTVGA